jgi:hypothetical protein
LHQWRGDEFRAGVMNRIAALMAANLTRMRDPNAKGETKYWILEVHLVAPDRTFGGFYERLLVPADAA